VKQTLLAAMAAQETGEPDHDSGSNIIGDKGNGFGLLQIDNRGTHKPFAESPHAMVPAYNADYAAGFLQYLLSINNNNEKGSLSAYNAGLANKCGTSTHWAGVSKPLCYADSVFRHQQRILKIPNPCRLLP
jgi:hypothetical protein